MSGIFGALGVSDSDRVFNATVGQRVIYETAMEYVNRINADLALAMSVFVDETTEEYKRRFKLPGGGYLQRRSPDGRYGSVKASGQWDVAFPLEDFGAQISGNDIDFRRMTVRELDRHLDTVVAQNVNTTRFEILKALFNNTADTFVDEEWGSLTVQPLANSDGTLYPPVIGATDDADDQHYLEVNYLATSISDTNDPLTVIKNELEEHFGINEDGSDVVVFHNPDATPDIRALTGFVGVTDKGVVPGMDTAVLRDILPAHPGNLIGRVKGVWSVEWRHLPATYMLGIHTGAPKPLVKRVDPADMGIPEGLSLVAVDEEFPFKGSFWRNRFGLGCGNRLNGVALELGNGTTYGIPTVYQ
jgi:hypothetical protein